VDGLLAQAGMRPPWSLRHTCGCHTFRFASGSAKLIGLMWNAPGFLPDYQVLGVHQQEIKAQEKKQVTLSLGAPMNIYDVLEGKYMARWRKSSRR